MSREDFIQVNDTLDVAECCVHDQIKNPLEREETQNGLKRVRDLALSALRGAPASASERWTKASDQHPAPHARYLMKRDGVIYTVTPCYGMHAPWWVGRVLGGHESEPVNIEPTDEWRRIAPEAERKVDG